MITVLPIDTPGLGDRSYLAHDGEVALVVDPQRDVDRVLGLAEALGVRITHVFESHIHNDYVTGGLVLARQVGAQYLLNADDEVSFERTGVRDGDVIEVGDRMRVRIVHTPGHTHTHLSFAARGRRGVGGGLHRRLAAVRLHRAPRPARPRPHPGAGPRPVASARRLAAELPDETAVYPTHGFGSFCSATQSGGTASTIGQEKLANPALTTDEARYVDELLAGLDAYPAYYAHMGPANAAGPGAVDLSLPEPADAGRAAPADRGRRVGRRPAQPHGVRRRPRGGTVNFGLDGQFVTYLAWLMPWGAPVTLLGETAEDVAEAQRELVRVGIDRPAAMATGKPEDWAGGQPSCAASRTATFADLAAELARARSRPSSSTCGATRSAPSSFIDGSVHIPIHEVLERLDEIPRRPGVGALRRRLPRRDRRRPPRRPRPRRRGRRRLVRQRRPGRSSPHHRPRRSPHDQHHRTAHRRRPLPAGAPRGHRELGPDADRRPDAGRVRGRAHPRARSTCRWTSCAGSSTTSCQVLGEHDVVLVCRSGQRAGQAQQALHRGRPRPQPVLSGGIVDWQATGGDLTGAGRPGSWSGRSAWPPAPWWSPGIAASAVAPQAKWLSVFVGGRPDVRRRHQHLRHGHGAGEDAVEPARRPCDGLGAGPATRRAVIRC